MCLFQFWSAPPGLRGDLSSGSSVLPGVPLGNLCVILVNDALVNFGPLGSFLGPDKFQVLSLVWICWKTWVRRMYKHVWTSALSWFPGGPILTSKCVELIMVSRTWLATWPFPSYRWRVLKVPRVTDSGRPCSDALMWSLFFPPLSRYEVSSWLLTAAHFLGLSYLANRNVCRYLAAPDH